MAPKKKEQTKSSQSQNEGGVRKSSRIMGLAPSCSETTVSDNRTGMAKVVNPKPKPKQARKSKKRPTNDNRDWVDGLSVEPPMSQAEEALMDKLRADFEQRGKDTSRAEASTAADERAEKPDETHLQTEVRVETEVHEECIKSPSKLVQIGKRRKANHGSSLFNFINIQHKQSNPHQKLSQTVRYEFSQKWRQLPPDEKEKYKVDPKVKEDCVGSEEAVELFSLNTRCSLERFRSVVSEFTDAQKVACEELGFGVLVRMAGKRLRKCTVRYLVECVDPTTCEIKIHGQTFKLSFDDFARVMGLRNAGRELSFASFVKDNPELMGITQQFRTKAGKSMSRQPYVDTSLYPIEGWGDKAADKLMHYTNSEGGLLSIDIEVRKPGGRVYDGAGVAGQAVVDDELKQKVAELEAGLKECREQNADTSEKLGLILTMVQSISRNQQQPPQPQPDQRSVLPSTVSSSWLEHQNGFVQNHVIT